MIRPTALLKRCLIFIHRWLGVALSLVFMLWFVSGIVMMYRSFPGVVAADRLQRAPALDPATINVSADEAYAALGREEPPSQVSLTSFDGRPVYRFGGAGGGGRGGRGRGGGSMVYADDGTPHDAVDDAMLDRVASAWTGRPVSDATKAPVEEVDQWTVGIRTRPLVKYSWPDGQQVYVNGSSADVVQYTTTASRVWAYLGAIPHWMYFTPLRKNGPQWFSFVVWSSLIGTVTAVMGVVIIVWMYSPRKRYRHAGAPTSIPYRGWKRWHAVTGLFFGVITTTWTFSGLLSMGPFPILETLTAWTVPVASPDATGGQEVDLSTALRGGQPFQLSSYADRDARSALAALADFAAKELVYTSFAGEPAYVATNARGETRVVPMRGDPMAAFDTDAVMRVVREAAGRNLAELRIMDQYDAYYLDRRRERPLPVIYARMNDAVGTRYYIDPKTARVVDSYSQEGWVSRWLYHGLHSLDFPWLYRYRPLWDIVVITLMLGGTALCVTSLVLTWRVVARTVAAAVRARFSAPNEDLSLEPKV